MAKLSHEEKLALKQQKKAERKEKGETLWAEFKKFISKGSIIDMSVGVIMGGAFNAIVTAFTKILMSVCTWGVPGGINGLVTVLPALTDAQKGVAGIGQSFQASDLNAMAEVYRNLYPADANPLAGLKGLYTLHGSTYTYNLSAVIDWGTFINAIISFLIISITLFVIVKVYKSLQKKRIEFAAKTKEKFERIDEDKNDIAK